MKKRNKILLTVLIIVALLLGGAYGTYKFYFEPVVLEKTLEKAQNVLTDEKVQDEVQKFVDDMLQSGVLQDNDLTEYIDYKAKEEAAKQEKAAEAQQVNVQDNATDPKSESKPQKSEPTPKPQPTQKTKKPLMDRVKSAMTADEFSFAMSIYGKIDVNYVLSNINSNREEVKQYVKSNLTSSEISRSLNIYAKYSYLLSE